MSLVISVCGSGANEGLLSEKVILLAEELGSIIASRQLVLLCGGKDGVMKAACKGAKEKNGVTIGILPYHKDEANEFVDISLPTQMGHGRNKLVVSMADAVIAICGRYGTLNEISEALVQKKPLVLLKGSGGIVDKLIQGNVLSEDDETVCIALNAEDAVFQAISLVRK